MLGQHPNSGKSYSTRSISSNVLSQLHIPPRETAPSQLPFTSDGLQNSGVQSVQQASDLFVVTCSLLPLHYRVTLHFTAITLLCPSYPSSFQDSPCMHRYKIKMSQAIDFAQKITACASCNALSWWTLHHSSNSILKKTLLLSLATESNARKGQLQ